MKKQYSASLYSQKSATSAKSGKSFLSLNTWSSNKKKNIDDEGKENVWHNVKRLFSLKGKKDNESITTRSINTTTSSTSSISKLKLLLSPNQTFQTQPDKIKANAVTPPPSYYATTLNDIDQFISEKQSLYKCPNGILINRGEDSAEAIEERKKRRHKRREYILKLQQRNHFRRHFYPSSDSRIDPAIDYHTIQFEEEEEYESIPPPESSSSDTLITNEDTEAKPRVRFHDHDDDVDKDKWEFNPRIMFIEPSPVPRFRNVAPPPPPSPPYMNILVDQDINHEDNNEDSRKSGYVSVIKSPTLESDTPTVFAPREILLSAESHDPPFFDEAEEDRRMELLMASLRPPPIKKPQLYFHSPYQRGQTIQFRLQNTMPEDNIILFKFLTSNASSRRQPERYFVRPSAGRMAADQTDIMLFLNQVPTNPGELLKDRILVRWAVIQKNTRVEKWVKSLNESTRKKWIDMLAEQWPDQVTIQMTKIKIHFV